MKNKWVKGTALVMALAVVLTVVFAGCSSSSEKLYIFAYGDYFDPDIVDMFEDEYGIEVVYEEYAAPEDMYAKATSGANDYDLICASDYIIEKMLQEDLLLPIDFANVPNFANIGDTYKEMSKSFDPELQYSVPHFWGTVGILYDRTKVSDEDVQSWSVLFDERFADQIIMPNSERDAMLPALKVLGYDLNTTNTAELDEAANMIEMEHVDLSLMVANIINEVALELEQKQITVVNSVKKGIQIKGNYSLLYSIFRNLMDNSIAYAGTNIQISVNCFREDENFYYFSFADTGVGVPPEHLNRLFERFYRVDKGRSRKLGGTGLGLAIVKNAVIIHGGSISAKNNQGGGLEFVFTLAKEK